MRPEEMLDHQHMIFMREPVAVVDPMEVMPEVTAAVGQVPIQTAVAVVVDLEERGVTAETAAPRSAIIGLVQAVAEAVEALREAVTAEVYMTEVLAEIIGWDTAVAAAVLEAAVDPVRLAVEVAVAEIAEPL